MKEVETKLISMSKNKKKAQVRVLIGEGSQRQLVTRHVVLDNGIWVGRNPDDSTEPLHAAASKRVFEAQVAVRQATDELKKLKKEGRTTDETAYAESNLDLAEEALYNAEEHKKDIERNYPLYTQFYF